MMFFSIKRIEVKAFPVRNSGFTLLEMLVVVLLVALLSSVLMQGFVYMAGIYGAVERRQDLARSQYLLEGWLRDSIQGMVNGVDGPVGKGVRFEGDETSFKGISLEPLVGLEGQGGATDGISLPHVRVPHKIEWRLEQTVDAVKLRYGESIVTGERWQWYNVREWKAAEASLSYWYNGRLITNFPEKSHSGTDGGMLLPSGVVLTVRGVRTNFSVFIALNSNPKKYRSPVASDDM
ncbi:prepilin-type N-terminal cleavage/methylation domain-containing protein [Alkalimarinus coralli]|uniref:prepilin-type N-terminal cleavage/methylation domain-containing protein n=1 Tax=Alkalimarinus coralli TaxID=2935863 RepID=UPI00202B42C5|nr:prepilin-type N-terminal cleavage/methylation domain-containing protein [Alkalimarinus coralli]